MRSFAEVRQNLISSILVAEFYASANNQFFFFELGSIDVAQYDAGTPQDFEDFEEEWLSNESFIFEFVGAPTDLELGSYDSGTPQDFEDFEEEWVTGFKTVFVGVPTDLTLAVYAGPDNFENFEGTWSLMATL